MKRVQLLISPLLPALLLSSSAAAQSVHTNALAQANTAFGLELYQQLRPGAGNLFLSPYSISTCLAMIYAGARGQTETQMATVLHFPLDQHQLHRELFALQRQLNQAEQQTNIQLRAANALWTQQGHPFLPSFLRIAEREFGAQVNQADFRTQAEAVRHDINHWVADKTQGRIQDILPAGIPDASTRLVLANAIYFKGTWANTFNTNATSMQPFRTSDAGDVQALLMHHQDELRYLETDLFQGVEIPYAGNALEMMVLLPRQVEGIEQLGQALTAANLRQWENQITIRKVDLFLPRFKLQSSFELAQQLGTMGMPDAFHPGADFSGIDGQRDLYVSDLIHKAWVEVNEQGTEAAAATVGVMRMTAVQRQPPPVVFRADHPFIFLIRDNRSGSLLFLGRVMNPVG
ncbi:MAG TPA: serpin family protein [Verrucomicrobiae bacterium]|nr:serpin family protein [Verrucomicrobiae bacterium]